MKITLKWHENNYRFHWQIVLSAVHMRCHPELCRPKVWQLVLRPGRKLLWTFETCGIVFDCLSFTFWSHCKRTSNSVQNISQLSASVVVWCFSKECHTIRTAKNPKRFSPYLKLELQHPKHEVVQWHAVTVIMFHSLHGYSKGLLVPCRSHLLSFKTNNRCSLAPHGTACVQIPWNCTTDDSSMVVLWRCFARGKLLRVWSDWNPWAGTHHISGFFFDQIHAVCKHVTHWA